jgi:hypothetical protein
MTETVAMYINPPAVNGRTQATAASPPPSARRLHTVPNMAPMAVENCKSIACVKEKVKIVLYFILMPSESSYNIERPSWS